MKKIFALAAIAAFATLGACSKEAPTPEAIEVTNVEATDVPTDAVAVPANEAVSK